jgi:hypothetical protein
MYSNAIIVVTVRFEVFMAVTVKNVIFWDVTRGITSQTVAFFIVLAVLGQIYDGIEVYLISNHSWRQI